MAFSPSLSDALDKARNRKSFTPSDSSFFSFFDVAPRPTTLQSAQSLSNDAARGNLHRRFTTNTVPLRHNVLSAIGQPRRQATESATGPEYSIMANQRVQLYEKKKAEYEQLRRKKLEFQNEMALIERQATQHEDDLIRLSRDLSQYNTAAGHQSEPATPPEFRENSLPSILSRSNRFSTSQLISTPGLASRSRAGSQATSLPAERARAYQALTGGPPPMSLPSSKQHSDEEEDLYEDEVLNFNHRSAASLNRNSMPVTSRDMASRKSTIEASMLDSVNTSSFLFGDSFEKPSKRESSSSNPRVLSSFLQMNETADKFPILVRREENTNSNASQTPDSDTASHGWPSTYQRSLASAHNRSSMPPTTSTGNSQGNSPPHGLYTSASSGHGTPRGNGSAGVIGAPKLTQSYSTNDIPTIKNTIAANAGLAKMYGAAPTTSEQRFHEHNANLGRVPTMSGFNRMSRELSSFDVRSQEAKVSVPSMQPSLHATAAPFGPGMSTSHMANNSAAVYGNQAYYGGYGMQPLQALNNAMGNLQVSNVHDSFIPQAPTYNGYSGGQANGATSRPRDSQARVIQQRRNQGGEDSTRFSHIPLENLHGEIFGLCKDQHGCRYLQKRLEERKPEHINMIFEETNIHVVELMTDPFGNYLCQKLLEFASDEQRTVLMRNAADSMVKIAMNQHGTRALQKMIEFVSTEEQKKIIVYALGSHVVPMIQDLNGNHVIQKCLNRLSSLDSQFIFDAVAANCVVVGTHRHGCCVIQRCIDHATGDQKTQLIAAITACSHPLVQDPFGNYVLQYILDLNEEKFSQLLSRTFLGNIAFLSKQKFSSNVMEKCIRIADVETRNGLISEIINSPDFDRLVDDAFANYVVQTAWEYADDANEAILAEKIRPVLPRMRHRPYGRRFASKLQERDKKFGVVPTQTASPDAFTPATSAYASMAPPYNPHRQSEDAGLFQGANPMFPVTNNQSGPQYNNGNNFGNDHQRRYSNANNLSNFNSFQAAGNQSYQQASRLPTHGMNYY